MTHYTPIPRPARLSPPEPAHMAVTLRLADPADDLLVRHVRLLRDCVALAQQRWGFGIDAAVVLPAELQLLCEFPDTEFGIGGAIRLITSGFSRHVPGTKEVIWSDETEMVEIDSVVVPLRRTFLEAAPVRAGLVKRASHWPYSSAHAGVAHASDMGIAVA